MAFSQILNIQNLGISKPSYSLKKTTSKSKKSEYVKMSGQCEIRTRDLYNANVAIFHLI